MDAPTAKAAARNVKQRLNALGHDISLNHAYEAVAAMSGYTTWSVMKAKLNSSVAVTEPPEEDDARTFPDGIAWERLAMGEYNPTALVFGPDDARRNEILKTVANNWLANYAGRYDVVPFLRMIAFAPSAALSFDGLTGYRTVRGAEKFHLRLARNVAGLDILDLPIGRRTPTERHKARIVAFLLALITGMDSSLAADSASLLGVLPGIVDALYERLSDTVKGAQPRLYANAIGEAPFVDQALASYKIEYDDTTTWFEISEQLAYRQLIILAEWAHAMAGPRIEDVMRCASQMEVHANVKTSSGELLTHAITRCVSLAVRDMPFVRPCSRCPEDRHSRLGIIEIERSGDPISDRLMLLQALNHYEMLTDDVSDPARRRVLTARPRPHDGSPMRLVLAGVDSAMTGTVKVALEAAIETGRECVVFTSDIQAARALESGSSTVIVSGCERHEHVSEVATALEMTSGEVAIIHDHMVSRKSLPPHIPAMARRRKFHVTEWNPVRIPRT